jgi:hypothetical protein
MVKLVPLWYLFLSFFSPLFNAGLEMSPRELVFTVNWSEMFELPFLLTTLSL